MAEDNRLQLMDLWDELPPDWRSGLAPARSHIDAISMNLTERISSGTRIAPAPENIWRALQVSPEDVRVIIVGQDPYPTPGHAVGLAFSAPEDVAPPASLRNIFSELADDIGEAQVKSSDLSAWANQGVLLLNRVLTTDEGNSLAHDKFGWQQVTDCIIATAAKQSDFLVGVLWGKTAQATRAQFGTQPTIESVHPSPLSAYRGFFGSKPFSQVNALLREHGYAGISW